MDGQSPKNSDTRGNSPKGVVKEDERLQEYGGMCVCVRAGN